MITQFCGNLGIDFVEQLLKPSCIDSISARENDMLSSDDKRGIGFARMAIMKAMGLQLDMEASEAFAVRRWGVAGKTVAKSAVPGIVSTDVETNIREFFDLVVAGSIVGKLTGIRQVPFNTRMLRMTEGSRGYWVGESNPRPLSKPAVLGSSLPRCRVSALICATKETVEAGGQIVEMGLLRDMDRACREALDEAFISPSNVGEAGVIPASVTSDVDPIVSGGVDSFSAAQDIEMLIKGFSGNLDSAYMVTDPTTAAGLALLRDHMGASAFPDITARGGQIAGFPVIVSRSSPVDSSGGQIALLDPAGISLGLDSIEIAMSEHASLIMSDDPESDPGEMVSLFVTETVAWLATIYANWEKQSDCVSLLTGCYYGAGS